MADDASYLALISEIAELLRGHYRPPQYGRVILPLTVLRRFDCVAGPRAHNDSALELSTLDTHPSGVAEGLRAYIRGFSARVREIFRCFEFDAEIERLETAGILPLVVSKFAEVDLHPGRVSNAQMGMVFECLVRRFNELANQTVGDHFTPREVVRLMVRLLFGGDEQRLSAGERPLTLLDPTCGTGGMLFGAQAYLRERHPEARLSMFGQDYNPRAFAIAASDMLLAGEQRGGVERVRFGDSLTQDRFAGEHFDYLLANPPFGVDWRAQREVVEQEHRTRGFEGRFGAGLPRVNDGSLLFLQHMMHKFRPVEAGGSRLAIVLSGATLFSGGAGSGESEIRRFVIESDWLEAIVALPEQLFYNTPIGTYVWILSNRKAPARRGRVQLIDARDLHVPMARGLGDKRRKLGEAGDGDDQIARIVALHREPSPGPRCKIVSGQALGYTRVTVERPLRLRTAWTPEGEARFAEARPRLERERPAIMRALREAPSKDWNEVRARIRRELGDGGLRVRDERPLRSFLAAVDPSAAPVLRRDGAGYEPDPALRDHERVPLDVDVDEYFAREVRPHVPDAWMDRDKDRIGYEIGFGRLFHHYEPPRPLEQIDEDLARTGQEILRLLHEVVA